MENVESLTLTALDKDAVKIRSDAGAAQVRDRVRELLRKPLTREAAVQIALLNNRGLQAAYDQLGLTEAQLAQFTLPPGPSFSYSFLSGGVALDIERQVAIDVLAILTLERRRDIAATRFRAAQLQAVNETLRLAAETRRAFIRSVAAAQIVTFLEKSRLSAEATAELAKKLGETGAMNKLDQAREDAFYAEVAAQLAQARLRQAQERERLTRVMGLWGPDVTYQLPAQLTSLPAAPKTLNQVESLAIRERVDLEVARLDLSALATMLDLTERTGFINVLSVSALDSHSRDLIETSPPVPDDKHQHGFNSQLQIPIFDFGRTKVAQARETYLMGVNKLLDLAVAIRSQARTAYTGYRAGYDIAKYYEKEVVPLNDIIAEETVVRTNSMLTDPFELLTDTRQRIRADIAAIEALRDFWLANVDLGTALVGGASEDAPAAMAIQQSAEGVSQ